MNNKGSGRTTAMTWLLVIGILLVSINRRAAIGGVGPLIGFIRRDFRFDAATAGMLTSVPLICFAIMSAFSPRIARRYGMEKTILYCLALITVGVGVRWFHTVPLLFLGTAIIGIGIGGSNVLLPGLVKRLFPDKIGVMTGAYSAAMTFGVAIAAASCVPLATRYGLGWRGALVVWGLLSAGTFVLWLPAALSQDTPSTAARGISAGYLFRSKLAWCVTLFMGLQSFVFYCEMAWLPALLIDHKLPPTMAGFELSVVTLIGVPIMLLAPTLGQKFSNHQGWVAAIGICPLFLGFGGLIHGGSVGMLTLYVCCIGVGSGTTASMAFTFIGMRASSGQQAAELSGMAQFIGYILGGIGPFLFGYLRDVTHAWTISLAVLIVVTAVIITLGFFAGRNRVISMPEERKVAAARV